MTLAFYDDLLKTDSSNAVCVTFPSVDPACSSANKALWRRKAGALRTLGKTEDAVKELCTMLDTFYTEVEAWLELADIYASCQRYEQSLLAHVRTTDLPSDMHPSPC